MAAHVRLKNEFTEDEKCHNLMTWLKWPLGSFKDPHTSLVLVSSCTGLQLWRFTKQRLLRSHVMAYIIISFSDVYQKFRRNGHAELTIEQVKHFKDTAFLAHLSRRLTRWAYRMGLEPASVRMCVHLCMRPCVRPHFQTGISPRPAGRLQPNFIWSIIGVGERLH